MLICEVKEGGYGLVDNLLFVRPPGATTAFRAPAWLHAINEADGTLTLDGPVNFTHRDGIVMTGFLIHDVWHVGVCDLSA